MTQFVPNHVPAVDDTTETTDTLLANTNDGVVLSPEAQQNLDEKLSAAGGDVDVVARDIQAHLVEIDAMDVAEESPEHFHLQAERAFCVGQISYLEQVLDHQRQKK